MKFEDRSQEDTEKSDPPSETRGDLPKNIKKLQEKDKAVFYSLAEEWSLPAASAMKPEEREFVADSGASMHTVSRKDLNSDEFGTVRISQNPTTAVTANGEVLTKEEAAVCQRIECRQ